MSGEAKSYAIYNLKTGQLAARISPEGWTEPFLILPILRGCSCLCPINRINIDSAADTGTCRIELNTNSNNLDRKVQWQ